MSRAAITNVLLFQATWFACVAGGVWWGLAALSAMIGFSWWVGRLAADAAVALAAAGIGACLDTLWIYAGVLNFFGAVFAPAWIVMLWIGVGLSVNHSLAFFKSRPLLGGLLAAVAAPVCYLSGEALGAVIVPDPALLGAISAVWFVLFWLGFAKIAAVPNVDWR